MLTVTASQVRRGGGSNTSMCPTYSAITSTYKNISVNGSYSSNQLVKYSDLVAHTPSITVSPTSINATLGSNFMFEIACNEYVDSIYVGVNDWAGSNGGIRNVNFQGGIEHSFTSNGTYTVMPGDTFYVIVTTKTGSVGSSSTINFTPYNGNLSGTGRTLTVYWN